MSWASAAATITSKALNKVGICLDRCSNTVPTRVIAVATKVPCDCFVIIASNEEDGVSLFARKSQLLQLGCFNFYVIEVGILVWEFE